MQERLKQLMESKAIVAINFMASAGAKLVNITGTIAEVNDGSLTLNDIYGNVMLVPFNSIAYLEIKK